MQDQIDISLNTIIDFYWIKKGEQQKLYVIFNFCSHLMFIFEITMVFYVNGVKLNGERSRFLVPEIRVQIPAGSLSQIQVKNWVSQIIRACSTLASTYCKPAMWDTLVGVINSHLRRHLQVWRWSTYVHNAQLVYLSHRGSWNPKSLTLRYCSDWIRRLLDGGGPSKH